MRELWRVGHLVISEVSVEDLVHELTVSDLLLQILVSLLSALTDDAIVMHMEVVVTGVDHLKLLLLGRVRGEVEHVCSLCHEHLKRGCLSLADTLEVANWLVLPGEVAELLDGGLGSLALDGGSLLSESLHAEVVGIGVLHPVDGEEITEAGSNVLIADIGIATAVSTPRG